MKNWENLRSEDRYLAGKYNENNNFFSARINIL